MTGDGVLRRSQLVTPAARANVIAKALVSAADSVILDLEDAVVAAEKPDARNCLADTLRQTTATVGEVAVRINGLDTEWWLDDMRALCGLPVTSIVIPMVGSASDVICIDRVVQQLGPQGLPSVSLQPLIETPRAVMAAREIAQASDRNVALIFGVGDYMAKTGMRFGSSGTDFARAQVALAAHATGLFPVDHVWPYVKDGVGLANNAAEGRALGYFGKWVIHPAQVEAVHAAFMPTGDELDEARGIIAAYEAAVARGEGALLFKGQLVDEAVIKIMNGRLAMEKAGR